MMFSGSKYYSGEAGHYKRIIRTHPKYRILN
jgi:hypothetical protein